MTCRRVLALALASAVLIGAAAAPARAQPAGGGAGGSLMERVIPQDECTARAKSFPTSTYVVDFDDGPFGAVGRKVLGWLTEMAFGLVRWIVAVGMWMVGWSFSFGFADRLATPVAELARRYQEGVFSPLVSFALVLAAAAGAAHAFRGRLGRGAAEFGLSLLVASASSVWLLANPQAVLEGAIGTTSRLAGSIAELALARPPAPCAVEGGRFVTGEQGGVVAALTGRLHQSFVEQPYELVQWGAAVPPHCRDRRDSVLAAGPAGDRDRIVAGMNGGGCEALYRFNRDPSMERLGVALMALAAAGVVLGAVLMVAVTVVVAQLVAVGLISLMPLAALGGTLPGAGRQAMWRWAGWLVRALVTILAVSVLLTFMLVAADALLQATDGEPLVLRMWTLNLVAVFGLVVRRRVAHTAHHAAAAWGRRQEMAAAGGPQHAAHMAIRPPAVAGESGFALGPVEGEGAPSTLVVVQRVSRAVRAVRVRSGERGDGPISR